MTLEEKELLLKDLCSRLPYGVKCSYFDIDTQKTTCGVLEGFEEKEIFVIDDLGLYVEDIKPYLFPMDSMTNEQVIEFQQYLIAQSDVDVICSIQGYDWLHKNPIDYRGLIKKGLAIDATGKNIY